MSTSTAETAPEAESPGQQKLYGFSVLVSGFARMWRATAPAIIMIVINSAVQAFCISSNPQVGWTVQFVMLAIASLLLWLATFGVLSAGALRAVTDRVSIRDAFSGQNFALFTGWVIVQAVVVTIGYAFYFWPGAILWWVTVFVPLAAIDGQRNALAANFRAIASHPFRWIITGVIIGIIGLVLWVLAAVNTFFISGLAASVITTIGAGFFAWWWLTAWACLYRSRKPS